MTPALLLGLAGAIRRQLRPDAKFSTNGTQDEKEKKKKSVGQGGGRAAQVTLTAKDKGECLKTRLCKCKRPSSYNPSVVARPFAGWLDRYYLVQIVSRGQKMSPLGEQLDWRAVDKEIFEKVSVSFGGVADWTSEVSGCRRSLVGMG